MISCSVAFQAAMPPFVGAFFLPRPARHLGVEWLT